MNRTRIKTIGLLMLGTALIGWTTSAQAGFEFNAAQAPAKAEATAPEDAIDAPMPIIPTEAVSAEPLDGTGATENDHVLKAPGSVQAAESDPVYIRRQRTNIVMKADKGQPMDTAALLKATENSDLIELEGQPRTNLAATPVSDGALVIDPYPLDSDKGASHGSAMGKAATEQALMEQGGNLRTVAVPGKTAPGMIARAKMTSRYDTASQYMDRAPIQQDAEIMGLPSNMTPIPGGEGEPLKRISAVSATPLPPPAPLAKPEAEKPIAVAAAPASVQQPAQAQPVAAPTPIAPPAITPEPASAHQTPRPPVIETKISRADSISDSMPRPATPEGSLPKVAMKASVQKEPEAQVEPQPQQTAAATQTGGFTEAVGFGRDLPLALALSQVVPPEYSYAFGADVNVGSNVSWQGGKPWNQVMDEMLASQGLRGVISGNKITIVKNGQSA